MDNLEILFFDQAIVVVNKPGGLLAVPGRGPDKQDCVAARLRQQFAEMIPQPAVHRLDMYTTGLMVFAITREAHSKLNRQFEQRLVKKRYEAMVEGRVAEKSGEIRLNFRLDPENRPLQIYDPLQGKLGITLWQKIAEEDKTTRMEFTPHTGRTHQLRVHAAHPKGLNAPIVGDSLYGTGKDGDKMLLHATSLEFAHPETLEQVRFLSKPSF